MNALKVAAMVAGVGMAWGLAVESQTNQVAQGKVVTAETCQRLEPTANVVTKSMVECFYNSVPGGNNLRDTLPPKNFDGKFEDNEFTPDSVIKEGQPLTYVESYIAGQENEAERVEVGRLLAWSIGTLGTAAVLSVVLRTRIKMG